MTWLTIFNETGNLPSSAGIGILIALFCTPKVCLQNLVGVFSCGCLFPVLFFNNVSVGSHISCYVYRYHTSDPYVKIGSAKLSKSRVIASTLILSSWKVCLSTWAALFVVS